MDVNTTAWTVLLLPLIVAALIIFGLKRSPGLSALVSTGSVLITFILCMILAGGEGGEAKAFPWIDMGDLFRVEIGFQLDELSRGMMLIVTSIGLLVHIFSLAYMKDDKGKARYFAGLSLFMFSMTGIVLANNFVMMFIFWELVGVSSYILIGHWFHKESAADAAKKAFLTNKIGDFGFMIGILLVWVLTGSIYFEEIKEAVGGVTNLALLNIAVLCVFCGAIGKSAQLPLHVWLPDAMEGPTPVSALIHAATMVAAGVFMLARVVFLIEATEMAAQVISYIGAATAVVAALMALQQNDIKRILAYSTLSQLGYMIMAQGIGHGGSDAGMFHLYTHAFFKALLFLGSGAVIYACHHEQDIWKMGGLRRKMPITFATFALGTAALIAVPFTSGFWSKEMILEAAYHEGAMFPYVCGIIVAFLTPFYMTRLVIVAFFGKNRTKDADHAKEVGPLMWAPLAILAVMAVFSAYKPVSGPLLATGYGSLSHLVEHFGLTAILSLTGLAVGVAAAIFLYKGRDKDPIHIPLFANRFYIDEFYNALVRIFQDAVAAILDIVDRFVIDPFVVRFPALAAMGAGSFLRIFQLGNVQSYAFFYGIAVIALILLLIL
ncbi:MAG: NADH-quinone oxidoreductase subunit L [Verrucomicrobiales bacterium]|jgi:NADH-quinone oxidoreductase subunit L|nr:NADH-quinone oxidoreductase subunit L [Verrucomicrobiales bacterium]